MIRWFTENGVAANLLAGITVVVGLVTASNAKLELFPELDLDFVQIRVPYPGAAPEEVESGIVEIIESRVQDIEGIKKMTGTAAEGYGSVFLEVERGYDANDIADQVKVRVDAITNFPEEAEKAEVEKLLVRSEVISLAIMGDATDGTLKEIAELVKDELNAREGISQVDIGGVRDYEISINVSENSLRRYGLTFDDVVNAVRASSIDVPGGTIKSRGGEILLRTTGKAYRGPDFETIPLLSLPDGALVTVGDVASVDDGFVDDPLETTYNGQRAVVLRIFAVGDQNVIEVAAAVRDFAAEISNELPAGIMVEPFRDFTYYLKGRLQMLIENGFFGLVLVLLVLALFLRPSLAFFVMLGIPISFLGSIALLPFVDVTINLASLFGFILVLGIVVDDAVIVGESVFTQFQKHGGPGVAASVEGAHKVAVPVTFAIMTSVVAFIPILTIPGFLGKFFYPIPVVVILTLLFSLIQSKLVLPYHLTLCKVGGGHTRSELNWLSRQQRKIADGLERFIDRVYRPVLAWVLHFRYITVSAFIALMILMIGLLLGDRLKFTFFPTVPSDYIVAKLVMPEGTAVELTERGIEQMRDGLEQLVQETMDKGYDDPFQNVVVTIGAAPLESSGGPMGASPSRNAANIAEIAVELTKREDLIDGGDTEALSAPYLADRWRELMGTIPGAREVTFNANAAGMPGKPIDIQIAGRDFAQLRELTEQIKAKLATYSGLVEIKDSYSGGKREIQLEIKPSAKALGLRQADLGRQVRAAFYGAEAQRIQRGRDDIRVMVRYPPDERRSVENLESLRIRTPDGQEVPFYEVADYEIAESYSTINRIDRRRVVNITADADKGATKLSSVKADLTAYMDQLLANVSGVSWSFEGESREQADIFGSLQRMAIIAAFIMFALLAIPLKSYIQPVIVMFVIPFGLIGAVGGHVIMGATLNILSILGFVALAGVVVNDSLVLVDFINQERRNGRPLRAAIQDSGAIRFRPILLTSLTTFVGLVPLLFETSLQAQFLIPMAISLSFGVLFATLITLLLVPAFYFIIEDCNDLIRRISAVLFGKGSD